MLVVNGNASWGGLVPLGHICSFIFGSDNAFFKIGIFQTVEMANGFAGGYFFLAAWLGLGGEG